MNIGYIYILTISSQRRDLSNIIKIGYSNNIENRIKELQRHSAVWFDIEEFAHYEIPVKDNGKHSDKSLHKLICKLNPSLKISDDREFFEMDPWDAYDILSYMAKIHEREDKLFINQNNSYYKQTNIAEISSSPSNKNYNIENLFVKNSKEEKLLNDVRNIVLDMFPDLSECVNMHYVTFKKGKKHNVISVWPKQNSLEIVLHAKLNTISDPTETLYDISNRKWTAAQYAFRFDDNADLEIVKNLIQQTYNLVK